MNSNQLATRIRKHVLHMVTKGRGPHIGSAFSIADILAVLYGDILRVSPQNCLSPDRDRFILSKGHAGAAIYAVLAEMGFFPVEKLDTYYQNGSDLSGHVSHRNVAGVELSTGSLGHGLSVGAGMALSAKFDNLGSRTFVLMSDGECDEGSNWEAILFAAHHELDNLVAIIDYNKLQSLTTIERTIRLEPFAEKWRSFGWAVQEVDGHDHGLLRSALERIPFHPGKPSCVIAHTTKGKGVSFMENQVAWHYKTPNAKEFETALQQLEADT